MEGATGSELCPGERTVVVKMMCAVGLRPEAWVMRQLGKSRKGARKLPIAARLRAYKGSRNTDSYAPGAAEPTVYVLPLTARP